MFFQCNGEKGTKRKGIWAGRVEKGTNGFRYFSLLRKNKKPKRNPQPRH